MNYFVTGGTGFIGSHLVDTLIDMDQTEDVRCLVRSNEKWLKNKHYQRVNGDLHSIQEINTALKNVDTIFHIAGVVKANSQIAFDYANVDATENLIRLANKNNVSNFIVLSSLAAAGPSSGKPVTESDPMQPVSMYGKSKMKMEKMIHALDIENLSITILRPPAVYGPREDQIFTLFKMMKMGIAPIVGDGNDPKISMVYVQDVIQAILQAAKLDHQGVETCFISGPSITNWNEIRSIVQKVLGKKTIPLYIQPSIVKKLAGIVETSATIFGSYPIFNREKANEMILEWTCSNEKAKELLSYQPKYTLEEGLSRTLHWYKKQNWL